MNKRVTLLARKDGLGIQAFRDHWAGPHAQIALGLPGVARYVQNRVERSLWQKSVSAPAYQVDGIVEMTYADDAAMALAQKSETATRLVPQDEPNFIRGWTLSVVETEGSDRDDESKKVIVLLDRPDALPEADFTDRVRALFVRDFGERLKGSLGWARSRLTRPTLWHEPASPGVFAFLWFEHRSAVDAFFALGGPARKALDGLVDRGSAYEVDALPIKTRRAKPLRGSVS